MKAIHIGKNADGTDIVITPEMRRSTHTHVIGGSGTGKSKFLEWQIRQDIRAGNGLCLIDWHGTLYKDVVRYCAHLDVGLDNDFRKLILINPSEPNFVTGFNPFVNKGDDISVQIRNRINATIRPFGITDTNLMPTFENVMYAIYSFAVEMNETLPNAARLLEFERAELRQWAADSVSEREGKRQLQRLVQTKNYREWKELALSSENRIGRFLGSKAVSRFMGLKEGNLDLRKAMDEGHIVLVNLGSSGYLDRESARVFASLFLNEFFEIAMQRGNQNKHGEKPETYSLILDEFQEYITDDIGSMLDQVRKGGLHMVLAHQHFGHLLDNKRLLKSILANARIRAVFGGLDYEDACMIANEMFLPDLNTRQIKKAYYHTTHLYEEQQRIIHSQSQGHGTSRSQNWSESVGESTTEAESTSESSGRGRIAGSSHNTGTSDTSANSSTVGTNYAQGQSFGRDWNNIGVMNTEGWFTQSENLGNNSSETFSQSTTSSDSYSDSESESEFSGESSSRSSAETYSTASSLGGSEGTNENVSTGTSAVPVWVPIPVQELGSETEWSREEKLSKVAELLKEQQQRHCFIKLDKVKTQPLLVNFVKDYSISLENLIEYEQEIFSEQSALPGHEVDRILAENEAAFFALVGQIPQNISTQEVITIEPGKSELLLPEPTPTKQKKKRSIFDQIKEQNPDLDLNG